MKYAVMVPWDDDGYIYVTRSIKGTFDVEPVLHDTYEAAAKAAAIWGKFARIVEYETVDD